MQRAQSTFRQHCSPRKQPCVSRAVGAATWPHREQRLLIAAAHSNTLCPPQTVRRWEACRHGSCLTAADPSRCANPGFQAAPLWQGHKRPQNISYTCDRAANGVQELSKQPLPLRTLDTLPSSATPMSSICPGSPVHLASLTTGKAPDPTQGAHERHGERLAHGDRKHAADRRDTANSLTYLALAPALPPRKKKMPCPLPLPSQRPPHR